VSALAAALLLVPLLRLGPDEPADGATEVEEAEPADVLGDVLTGGPRYASAEALETAPPPEPTPA
jgi:hypothetical protein